MCKNITWTNIGFFSDYDLINLRAHSCSFSKGIALQLPFFSEMNRQQIALNMKPICYVYNEKKHMIVARLCLGETC